MIRIVATAVLAALMIGAMGCSSSTSSAEPKKLQGSRIPTAVSKDKEKGTTPPPGPEQK